MKDTTLKMATAYGTYNFVKTEHKYPLPMSLLAYKATRIKALQLGIVTALFWCIWNWIYVYFIGFDLIMLLYMATVDFFVIPTTRNGFFPIRQNTGIADSDISSNSVREGKFAFICIAKSAKYRVIGWSLFQCFFAVYSSNIKQAVDTFITYFTTEFNFSSWMVDVSLGLGLLLFVYELSAFYVPYHLLNWTARMQARDARVRRKQNGEKYESLVKRLQRRNWENFCSQLDKISEEEQRKANRRRFLNEQAQEREAALMKDPAYIAKLAAEEKEKKAIEERKYKMLHDPEYIKKRYEAYQELRAYEKAEAEREKAEKEEAERKRREELTKKYDEYARKVRAERAAKAAEEKARLQAEEQAKLQTTEASEQNSASDLSDKDLFAAARTNRSKPVEKEEDIFASARTNRSSPIQ